MVEYESENGFRLSKLLFFVIFDDFIMFYKPFVAKCAPVFVCKKTHPRFVEHVLLRFGSFSSILGSQEASYIDF